MGNFSTIHGRGERFFFTSKTSSLALGPPTLTFNGHLCFVPRPEVADVRSDQLPPSTTGSKNVCSYTSTPLLAFMTLHRGSLTLRKKAEKRFRELNRMSVCFDESTILIL